ncbi:MAG: TetR/AcrR family transcriptional regulator [bacterium]|nr:TetR/AcrR family transcriptional regulator [bacterium]
MPPPTPGPAHGARSTQQERSRATLERILAAAEELLETREFSDLTMADLARHAGCAVGTVYGRVPNKESLLLCLHERYMKSGLTGSGQVFEACLDTGLEERVQAMCSLVVDFLAANRGVTRAITNYLFAHPSEDVSGNVAVFRRDSTAAFRQAAAFLAQKVDRRVHDDPQAACEFGLQAAVDVAESRIVFGDRSRIRVKHSLKSLKAQITALVLAYLKHG